MVSPFIIFVISIAAVFILPLVDRLNRYISLSILGLSLFSMTGLSLFWLLSLNSGVLPLDATVAGMKAPFTIQLHLGIREAFVLFFSNLITFMAVFVLWKDLLKEKIYALNLILLMITGINGLILSQDLFNIFVFLEILSISTYALIALPGTTHSFSAGFKYLIAGGLASSFFLIGTAYIYRLTGTLDLNYIIADSGLLQSGAGFTALFLVLAALLIELKPFPANGWALDVYQAAHPGIVSLISTAGTGAILFILYKILPALSDKMLGITALAGVVTFFFSNITALKQYNARRLLGNSSIGQTGLLITSLAVLQLSGASAYLFGMIVGGLYVNHLFAKSTLFWLTRIIDRENIKDWKIIKSRPLLLFSFVAALLAVCGFPPFPGMWAKWELIKLLAGNSSYLILIVILVSSLIEVFYLFRWLAFSLKGERAGSLNVNLSRFIPVVAGVVLLLAASWLFSSHLKGLSPYLMVIPAAGLLLYLLDKLPGRLKTVLVLLGIGAAGYLLLPDLQGIKQIFGAVFLGGSFIQIIALLNRSDNRSALHAPLLMMVLAISGLLICKTGLEFFFAWEMMTVSSYLIILKAARGGKAPLLFLQFSTASALLILSGIVLAGAGNGAGGILLSNLDFTNGPALILILLGVLIKIGAVGFHLWLPGFYAEADEDVSPLLASVLSKAGVAALLIFMTIVAANGANTEVLYRILGWIGGLTAFFGTLMAIYQEDAKRLLAFSSLGQLGYIIMAAALVTHIGWVAAIYIAITHVFFKGIMFLSVGGVISRLKTPLMYKMGGMIKKMPLSFITFLIALIALSGVPPLTGFGGKWLLYTALIEKGWYLLAGVAMFSSGVAFLYCYRIIHSVFLGQLKTEHQQVKEASVWYLIPQYIFVFTIMAFSMYPKLLIGPISKAVENLMGSTIHWEGYTVISSLGYWNGNAVMMVTMGVFIVPLIWLLIRVKSVQKVRQFNIVYAGERPERPETTHYSHNFFAHYTKALGFISLPLVKRFWKRVGEWFTSVGSAARHVYTGNGQTYALQILLFAVLLFFMMR